MARSNARISLAVVVLPHSSGVFATAALAHNAKRFAMLEDKVNAVNGFDHPHQVAEDTAAGDWEMLPECLCLKNHVTVAHPLSCPPPARGREGRRWGEVGL